MTTFPMRYRVALLALMGLALMLLRLDANWSHSVDLAHHYALVARLGEFGMLPATMDPSLGEMNFYPWLSHAVAAGIGHLVGSNILGMQIVTLAAVLALWSALVYILLSLPRRVAIGAGLVALVLLVLNRRFFRIALHGAEVIDNFFFAQIVAQALAWLVICACIASERRGMPARYRYGLLALMVPLLAGFHLLPAIELLGVLTALVALDTYAALARRQFDLRQAGTGAGAVIAATAAVLLHPSYKAMKMIAENNGGLSFNHIPDERYLVGYCLLAAALSVVLIVCWLRGKDEQRRAGSALKYLGLAGLAVTGLCLLQLVLLRLGTGSAYAVKKYVFAVDTLLLLDVCALLALLPWVQRASARIARLGMNWPALAASAGPVLIALAVLLILPRQPTLSVARLMTLEHEIIALRDHALTTVAGKDNYVGALAGMPPTVPYMFSIGLLKSPRREQATDVLAGQPIRDMASVGTIIASESAPQYDAPAACSRLSTRDALRLLEPACLQVAQEEKRQCRGVFDFSSASAINPDMLRNFSGGEPNGRWTDGDEAEFSCKSARGPAPVEVELKLYGLVTASHSQRLLLSINGGAPQQYVFDLRTPAQTLRLPLPHDARESLRIHFTLPDATTPQQLGLGGDTRKLAIGVSSIAFH